MRKEMTVRRRHHRNGAKPETSKCTFVERYQRKIGSVKVAKADKTSATRIDKTDDAFKDKIRIIDMYCKTKRKK